jgi:hypothetical protein
MSVLKYLQFQPIDPSSDQEEIDENHKIHQDFDLNENIDEDNLEAFWNQVEKDIENDPEWFKFA